MEFLDLNEGLKHSATSSICTKALAVLMSKDYDDNDLANIMLQLFNVKASIRKCC
jgi:hypothetical protein